MGVASTRRGFLTGALALPAVSHAWAQGAARVVVVGGGFGGASCARALREADVKLNVTLVEAGADYVACPFSNLVIAGLRPIDAQRFGYPALAASGVRVVHGRAIAADPQARRVTLEGGDVLSYDRLVLSPGIDMRWDALPGYGQAATERMPHAWKAGPQTTLLRRQLEEMPDGGVVLMAVPANPYRCPPGPYERASLIAHYLKAHKPKSKLLVLDAKDQFSKQKLFQAAWAKLYPGVLEWVGLADGGKVVAADPAGMMLRTEFGDHTGQVVNVIPPQRAGAIAAAAGVADRSGWCPVDTASFESRLQPGIHVIGDAAIMGAMPKSAFAANAQAKVCANAVAALLRGDKPAEPKLINTCYSLVAPDYGISVAGVYEPIRDVLTDMHGAGGSSPLEAPPEIRALEAVYADAWFQTITAEAFG